MRRRGVWGQDFDGWAGGFDARTGEPKARWWWACESMVFGSHLMVNTDHDYKSVRAPRHRPSGYWQARLNRRVA